MKKNSFEVIVNLKTTLNKETLRKELIGVFSKNSIVPATHITIREETYNER